MWVSKAAFTNKVVKIIYKNVLSFTLELSRELIFRQCA